MKAQLEYHPLANIFPLMQGEEFAAFVADIKANGQQTPVLTLDGKIIDGRNTYRACLEIERAAIVEAWTPVNGQTPLKFVVSRNLHRRHLNESQRAMVAANIANGLHGGERAPGEQVANLQLAPTQSQAAKLVNVSKRSVSDAKKVTAQADPEVAAAVVAGDVSVSDAAAVSDQPKAKQRKAVRKVKTGKAKTLKQAVAEETEDVLKDENGQEVPIGLASVFTGATEFKGILNQLKEIKARARKLADAPAGRALRLQQFEIDLDNARKTIRFDMPYAVCPVCKGIAKNRKSKCPCKDSGWLIESSYNLLPSELRA